MPGLKDYNDLYDEYGCKQHAITARLPKCCKCQDPIYQEKAICYLGNWYCEDCEDEFFEIIKKEFFVNCETEE